MALQLNNTTAITIVDTTGDQTRNDFRFNLSDLDISQGGSETIYLAASVVAGSPMNIMPRVTLAGGERIAFSITAKYEAGDNTTAKRLIGIGVDSNDIEGDWSFIPASAMATTALTIWRSATAAATATIQLVWCKVP